MSIALVVFAFFVVYRAGGFFCYNEIDRLDKYLQSCKQRWYGHLVQSFGNMNRKLILAKPYTNLNWRNNILILYRILEHKMKQV